MLRILTFFIFLTLAWTASAEDAGSGKTSVSPAPPEVVAMLKGKPITEIALMPSKQEIDFYREKPDYEVWLASRKQSALNSMIFSALVDDFMKEEALVVTPKDVDAFLAGSERAERVNNQPKNNIEDFLPKELTDEQRQKAIEQAKQSEIKIAQQFVMYWKLNVALHEQYGGRIIFQQAGLEPVDAYRDFLKEKEKAGVFEIVDTSYERGFWDYYMNDNHNFLDDEEAPALLRKAWWLMSEEEMKLSQ